MARQPRANKAPATNNESDNAMNQAAPTPAPAHATRVKEKPAAATAATANEGDTAQSKPEPKPFAPVSISAMTDTSQYGVKQRGQATVTASPNSAVHELARAVTGKDTQSFVVEVAQLDKAAFVACVSDASGNVIAWAWNAAKSVSAFGTQRSAVVNAVVAASKAQGGNAKPAQIADVAEHEFAKLNSAGEIEVDPWERDGAIAELGGQIAKDVAGLIEAGKKTRGQYVAMGKLLASAYDACAALSSTGVVSNQVWGAYKDKFFPEISALGKNTASEAVALGRASDAVLACWPASQSSARSFVTWLTNVRGDIARAAGTFYVANGFGAALDAWHSDSESTVETKPKLPTSAELQAALCSGAFLNALASAFEAAETEAGRAKKKNAKGELVTKTAKELENDELNATSLRAQLVVGQEWIAELAELSPEAFAAVSAVMSIQNALKAKWDGYKTREVEDAEKEAAAAKAVTAAQGVIAQTFAELDAEAALAVVVDMLLGRDDAQELADRIGAAVESAVAAAAQEQEAVEAAATDDADADLDGVA